MAEAGWGVSDSPGLKVEGTGLLEQNWVLLQKKSV